MLDKITVTIKDLVNYLIPGILTLYNLIYLNNYDLKRIGVLDNTNLALLSILFSFLFGFVVSQFQIIIFYKCIHKEDKYFLLSNCSMPVELRNKIAEQIKIVFGLNPELDIQSILNDKNILGLCDNYVRIQGNTESYSMIERDGYLSTFSIVIFLPILLGLASYIKSLKGSFYWEENYVLPVLIITAIIFTIGKAAINFKKGKTRKIFEQFLVYSLKAELNKSSG